MTETDKETKAPSRRHLNRMAAMQFIYSLDLNPPEKVEDACRMFFESQEEDRDYYSFSEELIFGYLEKRDEVDAAIQERALELELELGRNDRALERIDTLIAQAPKHPIWVARRAEILEADGKLLAAAEGYQQAVSLIAARPPDRRSDKLVALENALRKKLAEIKAAEDADRSQGE